MAYGDVYQRRKPAPLDLTASLPEPVEQSHVERMRRLHPVSLDATTGAGWSERELAEAREWRRLYTGGLLGFGVKIPNKYLSFACEGAAPQNAPFALEAASDPKASIAKHINATLTTDHPTPRNLATDQVGRPRNDLSIDHRQYHRPTMSYKLSQVMGDYELLDEDSFDESMQAWGVTEPRDRIGLKAEATALGMMQPRGTPMAKRMAQAQQQPRRYIPAPHVANPKDQHFISKDSPAAQKDMGGRPDTPGKKHGLTMQASSDGFAPANTSIWFDDAGLANL